MNEEWREVVGYEGLYMVSSEGRIKACEKPDQRGHIRKEKILKLRKDKDGYLQVDLHKGGERKSIRIYRLVWTAFKGPIPEGMQINHINEDKTDNRLENLSLMTCKENNNWGTRNKRVAKSKSKMVEQHTLDGTHICTWFSVIGIQRELGYSCGYISACCLGKRKTAYGYIWRYAS